jgi:tRNA modification GTPase
VRFDTIVAPITGTPPSAVAWVRLSGPEAWVIASRVFAPWPEKVEARRAIYGHYAAGDDGMALPFAEGHSYTGEETVELSMHGSYASLRAVVDACLASGARLAEPGEFTQRAFLNGRIDLSQAEAVRETIEALTETQLRQASRNREGALRDEVESMCAELMRLLAALEASVDFSEEIGDFDRLAASESIMHIVKRLERLRSGARAARLVRDGYRIAIVGPPNAGKSSLMNRLLGSNRAIVTDIPGTTRDFVEERLDLDGVPVVLVDTAGLRQTEDPIEQIGIERALAQARMADDVWYVHDASLGMVETDVDWLRQLGRPVEVLSNKADLGMEGAWGTPVSALTGLNIDSLVESVRRDVLRHAPEIAINERHAVILDGALATLQDLEGALSHQSPDDLLSVFLQEVIATLGRITGETAEPDMIERIFHDFCVGK